MWGEGEEWTVDPVPRVDLGGEDAPEEASFYRVGGALVLSDGRIVVGNRGTNQLVFFDSSGQFLTTKGGEGGGPGEFWGLYRLWAYRNDSLLAFDDLSNRVSVFDSEGSFVRSWRAEIPGGARFGFFFPMSQMGDGSVILATRTESWVPPRGAVDTGR